MKKSIAAAALLGLLSLTLILSSCAGSESKTVKLDPKNPVTLDVWHYYNGSQKTAFDSLVTEFNQTVGLEQGIIVEGRSQGNVNDLIEKVMESANRKVGADEIPNIFAAYADTAWQVDQMGLAADLSQYLTDDEIDEYLDSYIEEGRLGEDGALKIFPTAKSTEIFMLNQTDWEPFAAAVGAKLSDLKTIEGLTRTAEKYYQWTDQQTPDIPDDGKAFYGRDALANYFIIGCRQLGVEIFQADGNQVTLNIDQDVIRTLWDNYYIPFINGWFTANGRFRSDDARTGDILALVGSCTSAMYFPDMVTINDTDSHPVTALVMAPPCFQAGELYAVQQGAGMVVAKATPEEEYASTVFLKWFTAPERNLDFSIRSGYLPVTKKANNPAELEKSLETLAEKEEISESLKLSLPVSLDTVATHKMYTNRAFQGGTDARNVLEHSLADQCKADAAKVQELVQAGMPRAQAAAQFDTDEHFEAWFEQFQADLRSSAESGKGQK